MAQFKQVTEQDGKTAYVNMEQVRFMQSFPTFTILCFGEGAELQVKESPNDILMGKTLRNM